MKSICTLGCCIRTECEDAGKRLYSLLKNSVAQQQNGQLAEFFADCLKRVKDIHFHFDRDTVVLFCSEEDRIQDADVVQSLNWLNTHIGVIELQINCINIERKLYGEYLYRDGRLFRYEIPRSEFPEGDLLDDSYFVSLESIYRRHRITKEIKITSKQH